MRRAAPVLLLATLSLAAGCSEEKPSAAKASASAAPAATASASPPPSPSAEPAPAATAAAEASAEGKPTGGDLAAELADLALAEAAIDGALKRDGKTELAAGAVDASACATACAALASMKRATRRVCEMVGDRDGKCVDGRARTSTAEARVKAACPACG